MEFDVLPFFLIVCLSEVSTRVVRQLEDIQIDEVYCPTYTTGGLLRLDCSERGLRELPSNLDINAQVVDLSNNNFENFPEQLQNFLQLKLLDLSGNRLNKPLPLFIDQLMNLKTVNLSNNNYEIWSGSAESTSITTLDLSRNKISIIDAAAIASFPNLINLNLAENRIYDLPPKLIDNAKYLETLSLCRNYFSDVPTFQSKSLQTLRMSSCQISNLKPDSLAGMKSLLTIDLSMNEIEQIPDNFASNTLQELDLSYNEIGSLTDHSFSSVPYLEVLNLRGNAFRDIWSPSLFFSNHLLRKVHVKGNRWSCEGFSVNLLLMYEFLVSRVGDAGSLICYTPSNVTQMSWQQAYIQTWHSESTTETYTVMAVMIGIIIGIVITSLVCRALMVLNRSEPPRAGAGTTNLNGVVTQPRAESVEIRVPLREDLPPSYDEALLMPRLNSSFHSLPDFVDEEPPDVRRNYRRSRSIGDLTEPRPRPADRRSVRRTVEIHIRQTDDIV